jgi:polyhydroxyalkanoate synthesis regulator phasin
MRLLKLPGGFGTGVLVGIGAATLIPLAARMLAGAGKPLIKEAVKGGLLVMDQGKSLYNETRSSISDASTEAKEEVSAAQAKAESKKSTTASTKSESSAS